MIYVYQTNADGIYPKRQGLCGAARIPPGRVAQGDTLQVTRDIRWDLIPGATLPAPRPRKIR